jgi:hypothetical protein
MATKKVGKTQNAPHAVRIALLDITRCTEQMAVLTSYAAGLRRERANEPGLARSGTTGLNKETLRRSVLNAFVHGLDFSMLRNARLVHLDPTLLGFSEAGDRPGHLLGDKHVDPSLKAVCQGREKQKKEEKNKNEDSKKKKKRKEGTTFLDQWRLRLTHGIGLMRGPEPAANVFESELDLIISPVDGLRDLIRGHHGGSLSIVAGGPRGAFAGPGSQGDLFRRYGIEFPQPISTGDFEPPCARLGADARPVFYLRHYFVIVVQDEGLATLCGKRLGVAAGDASESARARVNARPDAATCPIDTVPEIQKFFSEDLLEWGIVDKAGRAVEGEDDNKMRSVVEEVVVPVIATVNADETCLGFQGLLHYGYPVRVFHGSGVGAALAVMIGKRDYNVFVGVVREPTAYMIATAAACRGAHMFAVPLESTPVGPTGASDVRGGARNGSSDIDAGGGGTASLPSARKTAKRGSTDGAAAAPGDGPPGNRKLIIRHELKCPVGAPVLTVRDFVTDPNVFLVATGISHHPVLKGTRITPEGIAETHTLTLNARSRSSRVISHHRDLREDAFHPISPGEDMPSAVDVIKEFVNDLPQRAEWCETRERILERRASEGARDPSAPPS